MRKIIIALYCLCFLLILFASPLAFFSNYEEKAYHPEEYENKYPKVTISSATDVSNLYASQVAISVDTNKLTPTHYYRKIYGFHEATGVSHGSYLRARTQGRNPLGRTPLYTDSVFEMLLNRDEAIYGQYYDLQLEDGKHVLLLINDTMISVKKQDKLELPSVFVNELIFENTVGKNDGDELVERLAKKHSLIKREDERVYLLDAANQADLILNRELKELCNRHLEQYYILLFIGLIGVAGISVLSFIVAIRKKNNVN